jgi:energy-coupling factor transporter ATP-binding protein EcfA2
LPTEPRTGPIVYVRKAAIENISPKPLVAGGQLMVTLRLQLAKPIPQSDLVKSMRVFIDSVEAPRFSIAGPAQSVGPGTAETSGPTAADEPDVGITLFVTAPANLTRGRMLVLSVYSELDLREVTSVPVEGPPEPVTSGYLQSPVLWIGALTALLLGALAFYFYATQRRRAMEEFKAREMRIHELESSVQQERWRASELGRLQDSPDPSPRSESPGRPAELPEELFTALDQQDLVLVLGAGASAQAGLATSRALWLNVLDRYSGRGQEGQSKDARQLVATGSSESAAEIVISILGREGVVRDLVAELLDGKQPATLHHKLAQLPLRAMIDMTWDDLAPQALGKRSDRLFTPLRHDGIAQSLREGQLTILKPLGTLREPETVALSQREYRLALSKAPEFERSLAALFSTRTLLFVGFSLEGLEQFLSSLPPQLDVAERRHFALMPDGGSAVELWQAGLGRRFGMQLLLFRPSNDFREVGAAVDALVARAARSVAQPGGAAAQTAPSSLQLKYLQLSSIGVFRSLRMDFEPGWTLLLGNNGGGKSTILRAVVLALAGNDPRAVAAGARLLRSGEDHGSIELGIGTTKIVTALVRDGTKVLLNSPQATLLQAGQLLVLGFPALRGVSTAAVRGPTTAAAANPSVDDVAPLLQGGVDGRMDNLQQWVVNTALRAEAAPREARMLDTFQKLLGSMVPGGGLTYKRVDRQSWQVILQSLDGEVRLDSVSQGMSAILNWIGILLQRLYDVYPKSAAPEQEAAIVLVDEIDAHLHPDWQRRLVTLCRQYFPQVQFVASSHSALLAGTVTHSELRLVARDEISGDIRAERPLEDMSGQKAEDILVSSLFSLQTTRSLEAEETIRRYLQLFQKVAPTQAEESELQTLAEQVKTLNFGATREQKRQIDELRAQVQQNLSQLSGDTMRALSAKLHTSSDDKPTDGRP